MSLKNLHRCLILFLVDCEWTKYGEPTECFGTCGIGNQTFSRMKNFTTQDATLYDPQVPDYDHPVPSLYNIYHPTVKTCDGESFEIRNCSLKPCPSMNILIYLSAQIRGHS